MGHLTSCQVVALRCFQPSSPQAIIIVLHAQLKQGGPGSFAFQSDKRRRFVCKTSESRRADEGGAKEVRMMIMGPDPAQDNLTVHKLLSDTEAPVTQLAEESLGSSLSKRLGLVCGSYG